MRSETRSTRISAPDVRRSRVAQAVGLLGALGLLVQPGAAQAAPNAQEARAPHVATVEAFAAGQRDAPLARSLGTIVEADGFVLTAYEGLIDRATGRLAARFTVVPHESGQRLPAKIVGVEPTIGIAILKAESPAPLRASRVDREGGLDVGRDIFAPTSLDAKPTARAHGRIAGLNTRECYQESLTSTMFRAELTIPRSARGAPVFTDSGGVIGLYTAYEPTAEAGHAEDPEEVHVLPIKLAFNIYESLKTKKSLRSPWTGFSVRRLADEEQQRWFPASKGHRGGIAIEYVWAGSPAEKLGVKPGDILVQFSHNRIQSVGDFQKWLYMYGVGRGREAGLPAQRRVSGGEHRDRRTAGVGHTSLGAARRASPARQPGAQWESPIACGHRPRSNGAARSRPCSRVSV